MVIAQFGDRVLVTAATMRIVAYREGPDGVERFKIPQANDVPWFDPIVDAWPGLPVPLETDPPRGPRFLLEPGLNGEALVRYRRLPVNPLVGIVIGNTYRWEGVVSNHGLVGARRSLAVYQVAIQPTRSSKALVLYVHPSDLSHIDQPEQPAAVLSRSGRLGGQ
jgi:hypothetical protein